MSDKILVVLFRPRGIDFFQTPKGALLTHTDDSLKIDLSRAGSHLKKLDYRDSGLLRLHDVVLSACGEFSSRGELLNQSMDVFAARLPRPRGRRERRQTARTELQDIYENLSIGDGADAYMGDGMWVTPDGEVYER